MRRDSPTALLKRTKSLLWTSCERSSKSSNEMSLYHLRQVSMVTVDQSEPLLLLRRQHPEV